MGKLNAVLVGLITPNQNEERTKEYLDELAFLADTNNIADVKRFVQRLDYPNTTTYVGEGKLHVAVLDLGVTKKVTNFLMGMDCHLTVFPANTSAEEIMRHNPQGIVITNGPGNPADVPEVVETVKELLGKKPMLGFCLGHLVMAMAAGAAVAMLGGTPTQVGHAVAIVFKTILGLVCDPAAGLVEVPCIKRNGSCALQALAAAELALAGIGSFIPADETIDAMKSVGDSLPCALKETAGGGMATTPTALAWAKKYFAK